jgi:hypothetical protein
VFWRQEGLKVPDRQPKRGRLWFNDGSCISLRPEHRNHVWAYDFVFDRTREGRPLKCLTVVDEYSRDGKLRDELLNGEIFTTVHETRVLTTWWRRQYNHVQPHSTLGYRPPAPVVINPPIAPASQLRCGYIDGGRSVPPSNSANFFVIDSPNPVPFCTLLCDPSA